MISRKGLDDLIDEYQKARIKIGVAASIIDDESIMASAVSASFATRTKNLITDLNNAYNNVTGLIGELDRTKPSE